MAKRIFNFWELQLLFVHHAAPWCNHFPKFTWSSRGNLDQDFNSKPSMFCSAEAQGRRGWIFLPMAVALQDTQTPKSLDPFNRDLTHFKGGMCSLCANLTFPESPAPGKTMGFCLQPCWVFILSPIWAFASLPFKHLALGIGASHLSHWNSLFLLATESPGNRRS